MLVEINVDGMVGPTHHFGGLGVGNVASQAHQSEVSHPRQAALEGLQKAWMVASLGVPQFVFLPPRRPRLDWLAEVGFGTNGPIDLEAAFKLAPRVLSAAFSSAFMWMANAATVTPASDSADGLLHCTPANLISSWHRGSEAAERALQLAFLLRDFERKCIHKPLPSILPLRDEGAANHMRLCDPSGHIGFNVFVYGANDDEQRCQRTSRFFPRHTLAASQAIARLHQLAHNRTFYLQQHPQAIDAGVFHNDVIATSCDHLLLHHEFAFLEGENELTRLEDSFKQSCGRPLQRIVIRDSELPLEDAVRSYLFNSQIIRRDPLSVRAGKVPSYVLICPHHCEELQTAAQVIDGWIANPQIPIDEVRFVRLSESMANGGGPACLRLRMMLPSEDVEQLSPKNRLTPALFDQLSEVVEKRYPKSLSAQDLYRSEFVAELHAIEETLQAILL